MLFYVLFSISYNPQLAAPPSNKAVTVPKSTDIFTNEQMKYTETLFGEKQEPVNFIFVAKDGGQLAAALQQAGWVEAEIADFSLLIKAFILRIPGTATTLSPSFWNTKIQDLSFVKMPGQNWLKNAHHLKIWRTNFLLKNEKKIYVAMANANEGFKWGIIPKLAPDLDTERKLLYQDLDRTGKIESHLKVQLVKPLIGTNFIGDEFFTDGKVYIISVR